MSEVKFRKKPVVIEAMQFDGTKQTGYEILKWAGPNCGMEYVQTPIVGIMRINTLEGVVSAGIGDWIIKGVANEFYPIKNEIFVQTYEHTDFHGCAYCFIEMPEAHFNRRYCSNSCYEKARYERDGQRSTPEQRSKWYELRKRQPGYIEKIRAEGRLRAKEIKKFLSDYKLERGCTDCGYKEHHAALDFDHVIGKKERNVCFSKSIEQAKREIEKCEVVCSNCHRIRTYERIYPCKPDIFEKTYEKVSDD